MQRLRLKPVLAIALAGLAACGGGNGGERGDTSLGTACHLLTTDEAEGLLGVETNGPSEDTDRVGSTYCEWVSKDTDDGLGASSGDRTADLYSVAVVHERGLEAAQAFEQDRAGYEAEGNLEAVERVGDDAFYDSGLRVRVGDVTFETIVSPSDRHPLTADEQRALERRTANLVLEHLGPVEGANSVETALECARTKRCLGARYRACDLIPDAEVARIVGYTLTEVNGAAFISGSKDSGSCVYELHDLAAEALAEKYVQTSVELWVEPNDGDAEYKFSTRGLGELKETLPGLGTKAFYDPLGNSVSVLAGNRIFVSVEYPGVETPDGEEFSPVDRRAVIELATIAAGNV